jgi:hypothetical protein
MPTRASDGWRPALSESDEPRRPQLRTRRIGPGWLIVERRFDNYTSVIVTLTDDEATWLAADLVATVLYFPEDDE